MITDVFWIFSRYSIDVLLMFSKCSIDVLRMFAGFFQDVFRMLLKWSKGIRWSPAIRWSQLFDDPQLFDDEAAPTADSYAHSKIVTSTTIYVYNIKLKLCAKRILAVREWFKMFFKQNENWKNPNGTNGPKLPRSSPQVITKGHQDTKWSVWIKMV